MHTDIRRCQEKMVGQGPPYVFNPKSAIENPKWVPRAFTLIELLVVVAIIAVLIAILLPAIASAREQGRSVLCLSNLRQLGMAFYHYASDNKDQFPHCAIGHNPPNFTWYTNMLSPYAPIDWSWKPNTAMAKPDWGVYTAPNQGIWRCPSVRDDQILSGTGYGVSFYHTIRFSTSGGSPKITQMTRPAELFLIGDVHTYWVLTDSWYTNIVLNCPKDEPWDVPYSGNPWGGPKQCAPRHLGRVNIDFADGHAESWPYKDTKNSKKDLFAHDLGW